MKRKIAGLASDIIENPENEVSITFQEQILRVHTVKLVFRNFCGNNCFIDLQISKLKELRLMLDEQDSDICVTARKLVSLSLMEVFKDIIPAYRIRVVTEKEKQQTVRKPMS